jgi:hypothetical protein
MFAISLALALTLASASAMEAPELALPGVSTRAPQVMRAPLAFQGLTADQARAVRQYQNNKLELRPETRFQGGGSTMVYESWGSPWRRGTLGYSYVVHDPVYAVPSWGIYQGPERLTVPEYLGEVGRVGQKADLEAKIERLERRSKRWYTLGGLGVAATVGGVVAQVSTADPYINYYGHWTTLGGAGAMILGFVGGSFPSAKAERLETRPDEWLEARQLQEEIADHNARLGAELGLTPEQTLLLDSGPTFRWAPAIQPQQGGGATIGIGASF